MAFDLHLSMNVEYEPCFAVKKQFFFYALSMEMEGNYSIWLPENLLAIIADFQEMHDRSKTPEN